MTAGRRDCTAGCTNTRPRHLARHDGVAKGEDSLGRAADILHCGETCFDRPAGVERAVKGFVDLRIGENVEARGRAEFRE